MRALGVKATGSLCPLRGTAPWAWPCVRELLARALAHYCIGRREASGPLDNAGSMSLDADLNPLGLRWSW